MKSFREIMAIKNSYKRQYLQLNPDLNNESGIYIYTRQEQGIKYAYVGQAKHILDRLASHMTGYKDWIDLSLKKHKLYNENNRSGWNVSAINCSEDRLDYFERYWIKVYANRGYQLRNKTIGGQDKGKVGITQNSQHKGYYEGVAYGYDKARKEIAHLFDMYLDVSKKKDNKISQRMLEKFETFLKGEKDE